MLTWASPSDVESRAVEVAMVGSRARKLKSSDEGKYGGGRDCV